MAKIIAEKTQAGTPVVMLLNEDDTISVSCKKRNGCKYDRSHNVDQFYLAEPFIAIELRKISSIYEPLEPWLVSFIAQMWEEAAEIDPFYFAEEDDEPADA